MVLSNAPKVVRNISSLINRTNICGGSKKGGLAPSVGAYVSSNPNMIRATNTQYGLKCIPFFFSTAQSAWRRIRRS